MHTASYNLPPASYEDVSPETDYMSPTIQAPEHITLNGESDVDLGQFSNIMSAEEATKAVGFPIGPLKAVIQLPRRGSFFQYTPDEMSNNEDFTAFLWQHEDKLTQREDATTVYCFEVPEATGRHRSPSSSPQPTYYLMGYEQLRQLREREHTGLGPQPIDGGIIGIAPGQSQTIGRARGAWLPNIGYHYQDLKEEDPELRAMLETVSHTEVEVRVEADGHLHAQRLSGSQDKMDDALSVLTGPRLQSPVKVALAA